MVTNTSIDCPTHGHSTFSHEFARGRHQSQDCQCTDTVESVSDQPWKGIRPEAQLALPQFQGRSIFYALSRYGKQNRHRQFTTWCLCLSRAGCWRYQWAMPRKNVKTHFSITFESKPIDHTSHKLCFELKMTKRAQREGGSRHRTLRGEPCYTENAPEAKLDGHAVVNWLGTP